MQPKGTQLRDFPGIEAGPRSSPVDADAPDWLNTRMQASDLDHAFSSLKRQRLIGQLGESSWLPGVSGVGVSHTGPKESPLPGHITHVFRGMSEDEFQQAKGRGYIQSDERGAIEPGWEGTNAGVEAATAHSYMPRRVVGGGRIVKMAVHQGDNWFQSNVDSYARTRSQIPWDRVVAHTERFSHPDAVDAPPTYRDKVRALEKWD